MKKLMLIACVLIFERFAMAENTASYAELILEKDCSQATKKELSVLPIVKETFNQKYKTTVDYPKNIIVKIVNEEKAELINMICNCDGFVLHEKNTIFILKGISKNHKLTIAHEAVHLLQKNRGFSNYASISDKEIEAREISEQIMK